MKFMKRIVLPLLPFTLAFAVSAQTNSVVLATETGVRPLKLGEAIEQALRHNFDVQIERYNPWLRTYDFRIARGGYDPLFAAGGEHGYSHCEHHAGRRPLSPNEERALRSRSTVAS